MRKLLFVVVVSIIACGRENVRLVPTSPDMVHPTSPNVDVPVIEVDVPESVDPEIVIVVPMIDAGATTEELDSGVGPEQDAGAPTYDGPGKSEDSPRCYVGQGKKLGLYKHGRCD